MKTLRNTTRLATLLLLIASLFVLASCFPGSLEMQSMTLDPNSVKTSYIVGDELDLSGMKVSVVYNDETLNKVYTYDELTVDVPDDATATTGAKTVTVSFKDPNLDGKVQKITFQIYVNPDPNAELPGDEKSEIVLFEKPDALIDFLASNTAEGKVNYGEPGFLGQFIHTKDYYTVGDDNIFKFNPDVKVLVDGIPAAVTSFFGDVTVSVKGEEGYETLVAVADPVNVNTVKYYLGSEAAENLIVTVDTYKGEYQFTPAAVGKVVKISVLPNADKYEFDAETFTAVTLEAEIIDAYNVYSADELSLIDNTDEDHMRFGNSGSAVNWSTFKLEKGLSGISTAGIVLHCDLALTAQNVPSEFFYTSEKDTHYINDVNDEQIPVPAGTLFLRDGAEIYMRRFADDFLIEGNFFTIDISAFPIVASPAIFGKDSGKDYGSDFSNAVLIVFDNTSKGEMEKPEDLQEAKICNVSLIGNAARDALKDAEGNLARAGGLIFNKVRNFATLEAKNIVSNSFFITYFPDYKSEVVIDSVKCYDSYQNAMMLWREADVLLKDSYLSGAGGPLVILQDEDPEAGATDLPKLTIENTVTDSALTGEEIWFTAVQATPIVGKIKAMSAVFEGYQMGSLLNGDKKLGILGLLMANGNDATAAISNGMTQGMLKINGEGLDRYIVPDTLWFNILNHPAYAQGAPFFTVTDAEGNVHTLYLVQVSETEAYLYNLDGTQFNPQGSLEQGATYMAFKNAEMITLSMGGVTIVFDFNH